MPDRGMVVKCFEFCRVEDKCSTDCPYWDNNATARDCTKELAKDVLTLLKEQEQKTGHWTTKRTLQHDGEWYCDQCEYEPTVFEDTPFCPNCGAKMESRWNE